MSILVTGGNGYIGSQTVWDLADAGEQAVVLDNLSTGQRSAIPQQSHFYRGDFGEPDVVRPILKSHRIETVLHLAGTVGLGDGTNPLEYYDNNVIKTGRLMQCAAEHGVKHFLLSSTSAVYDTSGPSTVTEDSRVDPQSPYGRSKRMAESLLIDIAEAHAIKFAILRYFNVAGADPERRCGPSSPLTTDIVRIAAQVASGKRPEVEIFGNDYPTSDGTCVRDYIHVKDISLIHRLALHRLRATGQNLVLNCGSGRGHSVLEVIKAYERLLGRSLPTVISKRRAGDAPILISNSGAARSELNWIPQLSALDVIVKTALQWEMNAGNPAYALDR